MLQDLRLAGGRVRGIIMLIIADYAYELENRSRRPVQLALDSYHRPPAALGACEQDFLSLQNSLPCEEDGQRAEVFLSFLRLPVAGVRTGHMDARRRICRRLAITRGEVPRMP
jgi:hypothetical protein